MSRNSSRNWQANPEYVLYTRHNGYTVAAHRITRTGLRAGLMAGAAVFALAIGGAWQLGSYFGSAPTKQAQYAAELLARTNEIAALTAEMHTLQGNLAEADAETARLGGVLAALASEAARKSLAQAELEARLDLAAAEISAQKESLEEARRNAVAQRRALDQRNEATQRLAQASLREEQDRAARLLADREREHLAERRALEERAELAKAELRAAITAAEIQLVAATAQSAEVRSEAAQRVASLEEQLKRMEVRLEGERAYSGQLMRWAREIRAQHERTGQHVMAVAEAAREATQRSLLALAGHPVAAADQSGVTLAAACTALERVLQATGTVPVASPIHNAAVVQPPAAPPPSPPPAPTVSAAAGTPRAATRTLAAAAAQPAAPPPASRRAGLASRDQAPVVASASGTVTFAARAGTEGIVVEVAHDNRIVTRYRGLASMAVEQGQQLQPGSQIGTVSPGQTIAYEILVDGRPVDPREALQRGTNVRAALETSDARLQEVLSSLRR